ncbi:CGNR zinc finger domain-containing protein [Actinocrispum wychmicini]|uniref:Putative RNA-binding Zn ribbon-like protein n=1 Tax=Actinocrispum wychmicini TaxID=1213861 RepID=A0A4R2J7M4_9PSEU|nr:CGNR zinc finger domain-containing protein [Actinocrispum wychmicini]TCO52606.1 putative RNA-binding Zn ribbon-like protein [Actinocrispum wychmicini]
MAKGTRTLTGRTGETYRFDPGSLCLELLLTGGPGPYGHFEILHSAADLAAWLVESRLALAVAFTEDDLRITTRELAAVKDLRDTMHRVAPAVARDEPLHSEDLEHLNAWVTDTPRPRVVPETRVLGWSTPITGTQIRGALAREAVDLVTDLAARVHECTANDCRLLFLDTSRSGNRRWCSMERCGNRNKVRSYRARADQ